jgi:hypothetical protein
MQPETHDSSFALKRGGQQQLVTTTADALENVRPFLVLHNWMRG